MNTYTLLFTFLLTSINQGHVLTAPTFGFLGAGLLGAGLRGGILGGGLGAGVGVGVGVGLPAVGVNVGLPGVGVNVGLPGVGVNVGLPYNYGVGSTNTITTSTAVPVNTGSQTVSSTTTSKSVSSAGTNSQNNHSASYPSNPSGHSQQSTSDCCEGGGNCCGGNDDMSSSSSQTSSTQSISTTSSTSTWAHTNTNQPTIRFNPQFVNWWSLSIIYLQNLTSSTSWDIQGFLSKVYLSFFWYHQTGVFLRSQVKVCILLSLSFLSTSCSWSSTIH